MALSIDKPQNQGDRLNIAVLIGRINLYTDLIFFSMAERARQKDINLIILGGKQLVSDYESKFSPNIIYQLANGDHIHGIIVLASYIGQYVSQAELVAFCEQFAPKPVIILGEEIDGFSSITVDNRTGLYDLVCHLIDTHDCHRIAFVNGPVDSDEAQIRFKTYQQVLRDRNIPFDPELVVPGGFHYRFGRIAMKELLQRGVDFDAVVSANDALAWGVLDYLRRSEIQVPHDAAVIGFDDYAESRYSIPPLSTVRQPRRELGIRAIDLILEQLSGIRTAQHHQLNSEMVVRQSCGCLAPTIKYIQELQATEENIPKTNDKNDLMVRRDMIWEGVLQTLEKEPFNDSSSVRENIERLFETFLKSIENENSDEFLRVFDSIIHQAVEADENLDFYYRVLSTLWAQVLLHFNSENEIAEQIELSWQQAHSKLGNAIQYAQYYANQTQLRTELLFEINEDVITTFDFPKLLDTLTEAFRQLDIRYGFLCINDDLGKTQGITRLPARSRLIMAFVDGEALVLETEGIRFPTEQILPKQVLQSLQRYAFYILPLRFQDHYLGHAVFEVDRRLEFVYDALQIQISGAIQGALLIDQLSRARDELEQRVEERTAELQKEINEKIRVEQTLRENEQRYRALFEQTNDAVFLFDLESNFLLGNQKAADILGYTTIEMIWLAYDDILAPEELEDEMDKLNMALQGRPIPLYERNLIHKVGHLIPVEVNLSLVNDTYGNPLHFQSIVRDISERKRTEHIILALNRATLAMRQAITPEEIFETMGKELKSLGLESVVFRTSYDLSEIHPRYYSYDGKAISAAQKLLGGGPGKFSVSIERSDVFQKTIWERETVFVPEAESVVEQLLPQPLKGAAKKLLKLLGVACSINAPLVVDDQIMGMLCVQSGDLAAEDIPTVTAFAHQIASSWQKARLMQDLELSLVEQLRIEDSLRTSEEKYRVLFELSPEAIILIGLNGLILDANQAVEGIFNLKRSEIVGRSFLDLGFWDRDQHPLPGYNKLLSQDIGGDDPKTVELQLNIQEGESTWVEIHPAVLKGRTDTLALQLIIRDITDRRKAEQAIQQRVNELETIYQTSLKLAKAALRVDEIAKIAVEQMNSVVDVDACSFSLLDVQERKLIVVADLWHADERRLFRDDDKVFFLDDYPATEQVINTMVPAVFQASNPEIDPAELAYMRKHGAATLVIIPLAVKSRTIGIIELETRVAHHYSLSQLNLAMTLANQIAVAFDNARLYEAAEQELFERLQAESALQESEKQFRSIFENAVMGLYRSTPDGQILMANPALVRMLGYKSFEELVQDHQDENEFDNVTLRSRFLDSVKRDGLVVGLESTWVRKDGSLLYVQESAKAIYDSDGEVDFYEGTVEDISARKQIEQERQKLIEFQRIVATLSARFINLSVSEIESEIQSALESIAEYAQADASSVWLFSADKSAASKAFGWPRNTKVASNQNVPIHQFPSIFKKLLNHDNVIIFGKKDMPYDAEDLHFLVDNRILSAILAVPMISEGDVVGALGIFMQEGKKRWADDLEALLKIISDIIVNALERKRAEENINQLNEELELRVMQRTQQLEVANRELEAFAYSVSHDLRAPLRAIDGFSLALLEDYAHNLDEQAENYLHRVRAASQRMGQLIDDLLKLSRVTRSEMVYHQINLSRLVREIFNELQETQPEREVQLTIQPDQITLGDERLLRIMLTNLCNNAWKFTGKKTLTSIEFGCLNELDQNTYFIRDNGSGFDMAYADKLFNTFQRLHTSDDFEGTGIGLVTAKRIVLRHGGRIWAESKIDQGATFYFTLGESLK